MFKATFVNCHKMTKRQENNYITRCEENLKQNTKGYECLNKLKYHTPNDLRVEIIYEATSHRANPDLYPSQD